MIDPRALIARQRFPSSQFHRGGVSLTAILCDRQRATPMLRRTGGRPTRKHRFPICSPLRYHPGPHIAAAPHLPNGRRCAVDSSKTITYPPAVSLFCVPSRPDRVAACPFPWMVSRDCSKVKGWGLQQPGPICKTWTPPPGQIKVPPPPVEVPAWADTPTSVPDPTHCGGGAGS